MKALDEVIADLEANKPKRGVINMSIGGKCGTRCGGYDWHFDRIVENGGIVATSAGNSDDDACLYGPAYSQQAISVGAYDSMFKRAAFSNYGGCVDSWTPGVLVKSASYSGGTMLMSGTS